MYVSACFIYTTKRKWNKNFLTSWIQIMCMIVESCLTKIVFNKHCLRKKFPFQFNFKRRVDFRYQFTGKCVCACTLGISCKSNFIPFCMNFQSENSKFYLIFIIPHTQILYRNIRAGELLSDDLEKTNKRKVLRNQIFYSIWWNYSRVSDICLWCTLWDSPPVFVCPNKNMKRICFGSQRINSKEQKFMNFAVVR